MKKQLILLMIFLVFVLPLSGQSRRKIGLVPICNVSDSDWLDQAGQDVTTVLNTTLIQIGLYQVSFAELTTETISDEKALRALAEQSRFDNILTGSIRQNKKGKLYYLDFYLYSRADGKITMSRSYERKRLIDFFEVADTAVIDFLSEFSGISLVFETFVINASGASGHYNVYLDGRFMGRDLKELKVSAGDHKLQISQVLGNPYGGALTVDIYKLK